MRQRLGAVRRGAGGARCSGWRGIGAQLPAEPPGALVSVQGVSERGSKRREHDCNNKSTTVEEERHHAHRHAKTSPSIAPRTSQTTHHWATSKTVATAGAAPGTHHKKKHVGGGGSGGYGACAGGGRGARGASAHPCPQPAPQFSPPHPFMHHADDRQRGHAEDGGGSRRPTHTYEQKTGRWWRSPRAWGRRRWPPRPTRRQRQRAPHKLSHQLRKHTKTGRRRKWRKRPALPLQPTF